MKIIKFLIYLQSCVIGFVSCSPTSSSELIFIGDSIIEQWDVTRFFPMNICINKGVKGTKVEHWNTQKQYYYGENLIVLIGTNNIKSNLTNDQSLLFFEKMEDEYRNLVTKNQADKIFIISILPRWDSPELNIQIKKLNLIIRSIANDFSNTQFIDVYKLFEKKGEMNRDFSLDGVHLNDAGYELLSACISSSL